jgi:hypothetical protein
MSRYQCLIKLLYYGELKFEEICSIMGGSRLSVASAIGIALRNKKIFKVREGGDTLYYLT